MTFSIKEFKDTFHPVVGAASNCASEALRVPQSAFGAVRVVTGLNDFSRAVQAAKKGEFRSAALSGVEASLRMLGVASIIHGLIHLNQTGTEPVCNFEYGFSLMGPYALCGKESVVGYLSVKGWDSLLGLRQSTEWPRQLDLCTTS